MHNENTRRAKYTLCTGFTNVQKVDGKYLATITVNKTTINLGRYTEAKDAAIAYNKFIIDNNLEHQLNKGVCL